MNEKDVAQIGLFIGCLFAVTPLLGGIMARIFTGGKPPFALLFGKVERIIYRFCGIDPKQEMTWKGYLGALLAFNGLGIIAVTLLLMTQGWFPVLNPQNLPGISFPLAFNTAVSFATNTDWQAYSGESTLSYGAQMMALCVQNFLSAATGIAVALALIRGLTRRPELPPKREAREGREGTLGNFWADLTRATLYVLLPLAFILSLILIQQGSVQSLAPYPAATTLEGAVQPLPLGPAASQIAIKHLGTNGGGFYGANSAHPFENPTPLTNFLEMLAMFTIPAALTFTFGRMTGDRRQGWSLFAAMLFLFLVGFAVLWSAEAGHNPATGLTASMEGKETRLGVFNTALFTTIGTDTSCGALNGMLDSAMPLAGLVALANMMLGEVIFGGVGSGLYGMLLFAMLTVFIAGLMVGRTPEYLGKKIEAYEITWVVIAVLTPAAFALLGTAIGAATRAGAASVANAGPHGFSEILYAFTSSVANNGSAFAGLNANTAFYNFATAFVMLMGRFATIVPALAIAGSLAGKKIAPASLGTFPTTDATFSILLVAVILIVGGLIFFPALTLGPIVEHLLSQAGRTF